MQRDRAYSFLDHSCPAKAFEYFTTDKIRL